MNKSLRRLLLYTWPGQKKNRLDTSNSSLEVLKNVDCSGLVQEKYSNEVNII